MATSQSQHVAEGHRYAKRVASGKIPACKWVKAAVGRYFRDLETGKERGLRFDSAAADRACRFIELLPHVKGKWAKAKELIKLQPWQKFIVCNIFGWMRLTEDGHWVRRFRTIYIEVPRKNAKSTLAAAIGLLMLGPDEEEGAELVSAATTRAQANAVWGVARRMALKTRRYRERFGVEVFKHAIVREETGSNYIALSRDYDGFDGLNLHLANVDELHAHKNRELWDVLDTAMGSREQPLLLAITTAGGNQDGICYEQRDYVTKLLEGVLEDDAYFGIIYTVDDPAKWDDPKQWQIANPNYGISVDPVKLADAAKRARFSAAALNTFKTKHLDVWVSAAAALVNMDEWKRNLVPELHEFAAAALATPAGRKTFGIPPSFDRRECWISGDLSVSIDVASLSFIFPEPAGGVTAFGRHYLPEELVEELGGKTGGHYAQWAKQGWLTLAEGTRIDFDRIEEDIESAAGRFKLLGYCFDPWQSHQMVAHLQAKGLPCVEIKPNVGNYSPALKEFLALIKSLQFRHAGDPCATWMVSNVVGKEDYKGNIYPRKERPTAKIDWLVATLGAMNRVVANIAESGGSVYETRGVAVF